MRRSFHLILVVLSKTECLTVQVLVVLLSPLSLQPDRVPLRHLLVYDFPHHRSPVFESIRLVSHATRVSSHAPASVVLRAQEAGPPGSRVH